MPEQQPQEKDVSTNPPGERGQAQNREQESPAGEPSPGLKDKEAKTSNSYGNTRESGEEPN